MSAANATRGGAVWQLVGLITRRSQVQILPALPPSRKAGPREGLGLLSWSPAARLTAWASRPETGASGPRKLGRACLVRGQPQAGLRAHALRRASGHLGRFRC